MPASHDPAFESLLRSNNPPLPGEEAALLARIASYNEPLKRLELEESGLQDFLLDLQSQMDEVSHRVEMLHKERARISQAIRERQIVFSPLRPFPAEILYHILLHAIEFPVRRTLLAAEPYPYSSSWDFPDPKTSLWTVAAVSVKWRSVAESFPKLWSLVNISIAESNFRGYTYRRLCAQLQRFKEQPLSVSIYKPASSGYEFPSQMTPILFSSAARIREFHLYLPAATLLSKLPSFRLSLPSLEVLVVLCTEKDITRYNQIRLFASVPKLQSLEVIDIKEPQTCLDLPWHLLKKYRSNHFPDVWENGFPDHRPLHLYKTIPQVEVCVLQLGGSCEKDDGMDGIVLECPQLRSLDLTTWNIAYEEGDEFSTLLALTSNLKLPALSILKVACVQNDDEKEKDVVFTSICGLIQRSSSPVTVLHFDHGDVLTKDLSQLLHSTPTLEDIRITRTTPGLVTTEVIQNLIVDSTASEDPIVPRLRSLTLSGVCGKLQPKLVGHFIQSRWSTDADDSFRSVERLRVLELRGSFRSPDNFQHSVFSLLDQHIKEGISFAVFCD
ncbi:hypothetical protein ARMSODRAFT_1022735 [Armillaria solidipes]|uniref:F-box domain-containing protein n=1 Tax=Armillaria solidipes TaxID=1076256 RepID=A0A2H3B289_9AGAR|nr:hypothetical protein ARMSODRAFT_1022735 [Armillaria solidipes]